MHEKMDRNGPRPNRTGNGIEYLISLNILWSPDISTSASPAVPDCYGGVCVCLSVCLAHMSTVQKQLNISRRCLGHDSHGSKEPCIRCISGNPPWETTILGAVRPIEKHYSLYCRVCNKRDNSILNNGMTVQLLQ